MRSLDDGLVRVVNHETEMEMTEHMAAILISEWYPVWEKRYIPPFGVKGRTVLDIGAGCGETAYLFLKHGASRIVAVESDSLKAALIEKNTRANHWNVETFTRPFALNMLDSIDHDFLKVDIEGEEVLLLDYKGMLKPFIMEVHGEKLTDDLARKLAATNKIREHGDRYLISKF